jgi:site-specific recombinase XerD
LRGKILLTGGSKVRYLFGIMKLLEQVAPVCRRRGLAGSTCDAYWSWIKAYLRFCAAARKQWAHPAELGTADVELYLNHLVGQRHLSASSQDQALCALVFLYTHVLEGVIPQDHLGKFVLWRSRRPARVPTVLAVDEVRRVIGALPDDGIPRLMVELLYGTGLRIGECCALRVRDVDLGRAQQVQTLLGHASLKTTMIYTHVMNRPAVAVTSPLDRIAV